MRDQPQGRSGDLPGRHERLAVWVDIHDYLLVTIIALLDQFDCFG